MKFIDVEGEGGVGGGGKEESLVWGYMCQARVITYKNRTTWHASKCIRR